MEKIPSSSRLVPVEFLKFLTYATCFVSLGIAVASLGPILPFLADNVGVSIGQISFAFTAQNLGYLIGSAVGGRLFDRFKSHRLMILSLCLMVAAGVFIPLMSWFYALLLVLFFFGLGLGTLDLGGNLSLVWVYQSRVGPFMNALHFSFGVGAFLSPIILSAVMRWTGGSLTWGMWALVILFFPGLVGLIRLKSPENVANADQDVDYKPANKNLTLLVVLLFFLSVGVQIGFGGLLTTYVAEQGIADVTIAALMTSIFWGSLTLGRLLAIPISRKISSGRILLGSFALVVVILGLILIWPMSTLMMWAGAAGLGLGTASVFPTLMSFAEGRMNLTGKLTGYFFFGSSLGMMLMPMLLGQVFEYVGGYEMMLALFAVAVLGLLIMFVLRANSSQENPSQQDVEKGR